MSFSLNRYKLYIFDLSQKILIRVNNLFYRAKCVSTFFKASFTLSICFFVTVDISDFRRLMTEDIFSVKSVVILRLLFWFGVSFTFFLSSGLPTEMKMEIKMEKSSGGFSYFQSNEWTFTLYFHTKS